MAEGNKLIRVRMSREEREDARAAIDLLREAAFLSYDDRLADLPIAGDNTTYIHGVPRYLVFMACERGMIYLQRRLWGFLE